MKWHQRAFMVVCLLKNKECLVYSVWFVEKLKTKHYILKTKLKNG